MAALSADKLHLWEHEIAKRFEFFLHRRLLLETDRLLSCFRFRILNDLSHMREESNVFGCVSLKG